MLVTESLNPDTENIDSIALDDRVRLLHKAAMAIYDTFTSDIRQDMILVARRIYDLAGPMRRVVIVGAGTSGRLALLCAREYDNFRPRISVRGVMAGGYGAMVDSVEGAEDNYNQGMQDLLDAVKGAEKSLCISISSSGRTPFNLGALEQAGSLGIDRVGILFNPLDSLDNKIIMPGSHKTTREIYGGFAENDIIVNPILGPEPIEGSTRMNGGTATQLLLDVIFSLASDRRVYDTQYANDSIARTIEGYKANSGAILRVAPEIAAVVKMATETLADRGRVYYIGSYAGHISSPMHGELGILDASECPPTFGASLDDFCGFIEGGWGVLVRVPGSSENEQTTLHNLRKQKRVDLEYFKTIKLAQKDLVIVIGEGELPLTLRQTFADAQRMGAKTAAIVINPDCEIPQSRNIAGVYPIVTSDLKYPFAGYSKNVMKITLSTISTAAYIGIGRTYGNRMLDLRLSNEKLIARAVRTVAHITGKSGEDVRCLFENVREQAKAQSYGDVRHFVPVALVMNATGHLYGAASTLVGACKNLRELVRKLYQ